MEVPVNTSKYSFTIIKGRINPLATDFCYFKQSFHLCWSDVVHALEALEKLLRDFAVPLARVCGERLVEYGRGWDDGRKKSSSTNWSPFSTWKLGWGFGFGLTTRSTLQGRRRPWYSCQHIQSCWRRYLARTAYLHHCWRKWAAGTIAMSWLMHTQMHRFRKALQACRFRQLENYRSRVQVVMMLLLSNMCYLSLSLFSLPNIALLLFQRLLLFPFPQFLPESDFILNKKKSKI